MERTEAPGHLRVWRPGICRARSPKPVREKRDPCPSPASGGFLTNVGPLGSAAPLPSACASQGVSLGVGPWGHLPLPQWCGGGPAHPRVASSQVITSPATCLQRKLHPEELELGGQNMDGGPRTQSAPNSTREGGHPCFALSPRVCGAGRRLLKTLSCTGGKLNANQP